MQCSMPGWGSLVRPPCLLSVSNSSSVTLSGRNCRRNRVGRDYALPPATPKDLKAARFGVVISPGINLPFPHILAILPVPETARFTYDFCVRHIGVTKCAPEISDS